APGEHRHDIDLSEVGVLPMVKRVSLDRTPTQQVSLTWEADKPGRLFSVYRRHYPAPYYQRIAQEISQATYIDDDIQTGQLYGYLVVPLDENGRLGMHAPEVNTLQQTVFARFVKGD